ncbi:hypothetical protein EVA_08887 [gut metagenome]|uniref:Uncharacterized protein n=1 Tax=gut metagenome TaxID=749906 RepID=J9CS15_9ZZZZ
MLIKPSSISGNTVIMSILIFFSFFVYKNTKYFAFFPNFA